MELSFSSFPEMEKERLGSFLLQQLYPDSFCFSALFRLDELDKIKT
jgi:hypothetical protein